METGRKGDVGGEEGRRDQHVLITPHCMAASHTFVNNLLYVDARTSKLNISK